MYIYIYFALIYNVYKHITFRIKAIRKKTIKVFLERNNSKQKNDRITMRQIIANL